MPEKADILIITATKVESDAVQAAFEHATKQEARQFSIRDRDYFDLGSINDSRAFMTVCEMGGDGSAGSKQAAGKGIRDLFPAAVIALGIAFGVDDTEQEIGDILVSEQLQFINPQRIGTRKMKAHHNRTHTSQSHLNRFLCAILKWMRVRLHLHNTPEIILRGGRVPASPRFLHRFKSANLKWKGATVHFGLVLSGEMLVDNFDYREQLKSLCPEAIGGEMEGAGLCDACNEGRVDWIVVKAICDWADGNKGQEKKNRQKIAAENSVAFLIYGLQFASIDWEYVRRGSHKTDDRVLEEIQNEMKELKKEVKNELNKVREGFRPEEKVFVDNGTHLILSTSADQIENNADIESKGENPNDH